MVPGLGTHELSPIPHSSWDMASFLGSQRVSKSSFQSLVWSSRTEGQETSIFFVFLTRSLTCPLVLLERKEHLSAVLDIKDSLSREDRAALLRAFHDNCGESETEANLLFADIEVKTRKYGLCGCLCCQQRWVCVSVLVCNVYLHRQAHFLQGGGAVTSPPQGPHCSIHWLYFPLSTCRLPHPGGSCCRWCRVLNAQMSDSGYSRDKGEDRALPPHLSLLSVSPCTRSLCSVSSRPALPLCMGSVSQASAVSSQQDKPRKILSAILLLLWCQEEGYVSPATAPSMTAALIKLGLASFR